MSELKGREYKRFENIKHIREDGSEYWKARELAPALEYAKWDNFHKVIKRAMIACENSGHSVSDDFPEVRKIIDAGQKILDYMGSTELIANLFRISQTEEKLRKDKIYGVEKATSTHYNVGWEVKCCNPCKYRLSKIRGRFALGDDGTSPRSTRSMRSTGPRAPSRTRYRNPKDFRLE